MFSYLLPFLSFLLTVLPLLLCDQSENSSPDDDIGAYLESVAKGSPAASEHNHADLLSSLSSLPSLPSLPSMTSTGACSADRQAECDAAHSATQFQSIASPLLATLDSKDYSQMRLDQLLEELISLTQKYPDQIESVIETYRQMINSMP